MGAIVALAAGVNAFARVTAAPPTGFSHRLRVSDLTGQTNGAGVSSAPFQTGGLTASQATAASQPKYVTGGAGGRAYLSFDGTDDYVATGAVTSTQAYSIVMLMNVQSVTGTREFAYTDQDASINDGGTYWDAFAGALLTGGTPTVGMHDAVWSYNGASSAIYVDGATVASGNASTNSGSQLSIGRHPSQGRYAQMFLYEMFLYPRAFTASDVTTMHAYYRAQYAQ